MGRRCGSAGFGKQAIRATAVVSVLLLAAGCGDDDPPPIETAAAAPVRPADPMTEPRPPLNRVVARQAPDPPALSAVPRTPRTQEVVPVVMPAVPAPGRLPALPDPPPPAGLAYTPLVAWSFADGLPPDWRFGTGVAPLPVAALLTAPVGALTVTAAEPPAGQDVPSTGLYTVVPAEIVAAHGGQSIEITVRLAEASAGAPSLVGSVAVTDGARLPWRRMARIADDTEAMRWTLPLAVTGGLTIALAPAVDSAAVVEVALSVGSVAAP